MKTTSAEKNALLLDARNVVRMAIRSKKRILSEEDYEELEADCMMSANSAIDDYDPSKGTMLSSWIFRYAVQTRIKFMRSRVRKIKGRVDMESCEIADDAEEGSAVSHESAMHALEITIDMARNDEVIDEQEYHVLVLRRHNLTLADVAGELGLSAPRIHQIQSSAVRKIRKQYRTAE